MELNVSNVSQPLTVTPTRPPDPAIDERPGASVAQAEPRARLGAERRNGPDVQPDRPREADDGAERSARERVSVAQTKRSGSVLELDDPRDVPDVDEESSDKKVRIDRLLSEDAEQAVREAKSHRREDDAASDRNRERAAEAYRDSTERASVARPSFDFEGGNGSDPEADLDLVA